MRHPGSIPGVDTDKTRFDESRMRTSVDSKQDHPRSASVFMEHRGNDPSTVM